MKIFGGKSALMLGIAFLLVGASAIFGGAISSSATQSARTVRVAEPVALLSSGSGTPNAYTDQLVAGMQSRLESNPQDVTSLAQLGIAYLQKARETNDPTYYGKAEAAFTRALRIDPQNFEALAGSGSLELSRHAFRKALEWGEQAHNVAPHKTFAYAVMGDALVELGDYDQAVDTFQQMVDLRPDLSSYSRVSYARELHGDVEGAIEAMQQAVNAGSPAAENTAWCRVQLGNLYFNSGRVAEAEGAYNEALRSYPDYIHAVAGLAQVRWAQGNTDEAISLYKRAVENVPLPQYLTALGDLYATNGQNDEAREQYKLVDYIFQVWEANGVDVEVEKLAFTADRTSFIEADIKPFDPTVTDRQDVNTLDTAAWELYRQGNYEKALEYQQKAMQLGTRNANFYYHLSMIQLGLGNVDDGKANLQKALDINPYFSIRHASEAAAKLVELSR